MTLAPRVQVYTQLSCNAIYGHDVFNHTLVEPPLPGSSAARPLLPTHDPRPRWALHPSAYAPESAAASSVMVTFDQDNDDEPDPRSPPSERCLKDPAVTARAAGLQTIMTTVMGVLSAVTTGWWGGYGDTHGRTRVLAVSTFGLFMTSVHLRRDPSARADLDVPQRLGVHPRVDTTQHLCGPWTQTPDRLANHRGSMWWLGNPPGGDLGVHLRLYFRRF